MKPAPFVSILSHHSVRAERITQSRIKDLQHRKISAVHLYQSPSLSWLWHKVHQAHRPARPPRSLEPDCQTYAHAFCPALKKINSHRWAFTSIGCGDGIKDLLFLKILRHRISSVDYRPTDISAELVALSLKNTVKFPSIESLEGVLCDLSEPSTIHDLARLPMNPDAARGFFFFGINPNFPQLKFFRLLKKTLQKCDAIIFSANLIPDTNLLRGMKKILPQYDNPETRQWLCGFLRQVGIPAVPLALHIRIKEFPTPVPHFAFVAAYEFAHDLMLDLDGEKIHFPKKSQLELFRSYRHTPDTLRAFCHHAGISISQICRAKDKQEAAVLCMKKAS